MDMNLLLNAVIMIAIACGVFGIASLMTSQQVASPTVSGTSVRRADSAFARYFSRFSGALLPSKEKDREDLRLLLLQADFDSPKAGEAYYGIRVVLALGLLALTSASLLLVTNLAIQFVFLIGLLAAMVGFILPMRYVAGRRTRNQRIVREGLPDVLDLLLVCSEAGLGLDMAIVRVGDELAMTQPLLSKHLNQIGSELRAGRTRAAAMRGFADRTGTPETIAMVRLLIQSDTHGTSITASLRIFSEEMRSHRMLRAEEAAQKVSAKLSMVLIASFMPALFIAIGAPVVFKLLAGLSGVPHQ
jgi:tight adherence protein C